MRMLARGGKDENGVQFVDYDHRNQVYTVFTVTQLKK